MASEISGFINYLTVEKGLSRNTLNAYKSDLAKLQLFLEARNISPCSLAQSHLQEFLKTLQLDAGSASTVLSEFQKFLKERKLSPESLTPSQRQEFFKKLRQEPLDAGAISRVL
ncbi:MAG: site-specific integrase [Acidobacteria bacterium]|nr:site-specific integrase [Acidobacteriota bacterium]